MGKTDSTYRIVIARDEPSENADLKELLKEAGCAVVRDVQGRNETVEAVCTHKPDCVILALEMDADTTGAIGIISALHVEQLAPVVVVSASSQPEVIEAVVKAGAHGYLTKPFAEKDVLSALHVALSRFAETRELAQEVEVLQNKLETRKLIERAKGILMKDGLGEAEAFSRLQKLSMNSGKPLKELAQAVILSETLHGLN
jgi:response regulator NasT